ncbi:hypothetical protein KVR01_004581 [Diaporthe batatas]|uniref:uncharacterized protein n=1 Tax=Diaporthe batatas TaxID=748121 RepID=UPI001D03F007|nr:uncharacterized protein KVR01_004581 [Diaporthe batatas]KAG8166029.1 hypothetical protein KVR01_004581 [Diaporthe batatas]
MLSSLVFTLSALTVVSAAPTSLGGRQAAFEVTEQQPWNAGAVTEFRIHPSCNASQAFQLRQGLDDAVALAQHAKEHVLRWGSSSEFYRKYFGNAPTPEVIGAFDTIVNGNKQNALFRCDDPDLNCQNMPTWAGHWRGDNATEETVICPTSFFERRPLSTLCARGYNVREHSRLLYWGSDLLHRLYHVPAFGQEYIDHYSEGYEGIIESAANNSPNSTHDSDGLQYFALDVYAYDIILPGEGCPGPSGPPSTETSSASAPSPTETSSSASATSTATTTGAESAASETTLPDNCHTHSDGSVHCT